MICDVALLGMGVKGIHIFWRVLSEQRAEVSF